MNESTDNSKEFLTNYDLVVNKTPEEFAKWMDEIANCVDCVARRERCGYGDGCVRAWLDWLNQRAIGVDLSH